MASEFNIPEQNKYAPSLPELDLLITLLEHEDISYPWNPAELNSEAYFVAAEQEFMVEPWLEQEIAARGECFSNLLDQVWTASTVVADSTVLREVSNLQAILRSGFAPRIPQGLLDAIAHKAYQALLTKQTIADQLVQCVQDILPNWVEDDLLVLARPFAYAMRGTDTEAMEIVLDNACSQDWTTLSEIEQARASLAIARYALTYIQSIQESLE